jgi:hypothetical protein
MANWWDQVGSLSKAAQDWLNRTSAGAAGALNRGGEVLLPGSTPPGAPGYVSPPAAPAAPGGSTTQLGPAPAEPAPAPATPTPAAPAPALTGLEDFKKQRGDVDNAIAAAEAAVNADPNSDAGVRAAQALPALRTLRGNLTAQIVQEENRIRDDEEKKRLEKDKPKNGDTRTGRDSYTLANGQTVRGTFTEKYENGVWKYVEGSAKREEGFAGQAQGVADKGTAGTVLTDGQGGYWMVDPYTGTTKALNGPAAAVKTANDPDGSVWLLNPDGSKKSQLFDSLPGTYTTSDGRVIGYDKRTGQQAFSIDTQTPEGRALAERLQRATVEAAELANQPKFGSAIAQYQQEASRRQGLARTELSRLQDLQKSGQISPDQAEAQFDRWMTLNVEGPLAGYKTAAEEERRKLEQENLTRTSAEGARVEGLNRERDRLAHAAGEAGRAEGITLGQRTRAPEYIADLGGLAQSLGQGKTNFQFSPQSFDVANFRKAVPNLNELADAAVNRLLSRVQPATARDVNVQLPAMPTGVDLRSLMDQVRYSPGGALPAAPQAGVPVPGQEAIDLGPQGQPGMARTVFSNGSWQDWTIPQG